MEIEERLQKIEDRNKDVEMNKAWETSWVRRALLVLFTYFVIGVYMTVVDIEKPWHNAVVPSVAFVLSTSVMPFFKKLWINKKAQSRD